MFKLCNSHSPLHAHGNPTARGRSLFWSATAVALVVLGSGCTNMQRGSNGDTEAGTLSPGSSMESKGMDRTVAQAQLKTADGAPAGMAMLTSAQDGGVEIVLQVQGMQPGTHGFHIHEKGNCTASMNETTGKMEAFGAAGGHFDPHNTKTHGRPDQSSRESHAGDAPNLMVGANGSGMLRYISRDVTLTPGDNSIMGRSLMVHEGEDDYKTNPAGNSGPRIACGVIEMVHGHTMDRSNMAKGDMPATSNNAGRSPTR